MGIIAGVTPGTIGQKPEPWIAVTQEDVTEVGRINIHIWRSEAPSLSSMTYGKTEIGTDLDSPSNLQLLCKVSRAVKPNQAGWSGHSQGKIFLQICHVSTPH